MEYRATLKPDTNGTIMVSFPDLPGTHSFGDTREDALDHGRDALETVLEFYIRNRRPIPAPSPGRGPRVEVPTMLATKILLHNAMLEQKVTRAELGRRLHVHRPQVDRLVDVRHASKLDQLEAAFAALGKRLAVQIENAR
ncbi:MAG: type II toxin-antitoxin system HicB family antitoxin [Vicinamibacterales bacterium]